MDKMSDGVLRLHSSASLRGGLPRSQREVDIDEVECGESVSDDPRGLRLWVTSTRTHMAAMRLFAGLSVGATLWVARSLMAEDSPNPKRRRSGLSAPSPSRGGRPSTPRLEAEGPPPLRHSCGCGCGLGLGPLFLGPCDLLSAETHASILVPGFLRCPPPRHPLRRPQTKHSNVFTFHNRVKNK